MRTKKRTPDYGAISRSSIKKDFQKVQRYPAEEKRHGFRTFASVEPIPVGMFDRVFSVIALSYPFVDLFKIGLQSGCRYTKRETLTFYNDVFDYWEAHPDKTPRIYWKDSL